MPLKTVTFRSPEEKIADLDKIARLQDRDRSYVINEALENYLSLNEYHSGLIKEGLRQSEAEDGIDHDEMVRIAATWSRKKKRA